MKTMNLRTFSLLFAITALSIIGYFEINLFYAEKLFWLKLGM